ncbi:hypothetical protein LCGC14_1841040 [marine sediment metagenome]|uniref:Band 7 domain-containing protein n=1 Tax=marine sediment metagenome TaxID=412755 RepID=A0A0F9ISS0_9ZZZZ
MDLGAIIPALLQNFWSLVPVSTIYSYQRGVKFRFGRPVAEYAPGRIVVWVPFIENVEILVAVPQVIETEAQTFETKDGKTITVSIAVEYRITRATDWFARQDVDDSLVNMAQVALTDASRTHDWPNFKENGEAIEEDVLAALQKRVGSWGVEVTRVGLINCAQTRLLRLIQG